MPRRELSADPALAVAAMQERRVPFALQARYSVTVDGPDGAATTGGGMVLHRPDHFRIEVLTPLSTPLILVASDGRELNAWAQRDNTYYAGPDAVAVLHQLTGGAVGLADIVTLLTGGLPLTGATVKSAVVAAPDVLVVLEAPEGLELRATIDRRRQVVRAMQLVRPGDPEEVWLDVETDSFVRHARGYLPGEMRLHLPATGWKLTLEFVSWDELGAIPDVFSLEAPAGSREASLVETLRQGAAARGATTTRREHPQP